MMTYPAYVELVVATILVFGGFYVIGMLLRAQMIGGQRVGYLLIFFAIVCIGRRFNGSTFRSRRNSKA